MNIGVRLILRFLITCFILSSLALCKPAGELREESPCGNYLVYVQRHPMMFAMPGQGSDAPATLRIANIKKQTLHTLEYEMVQLVDFDWKYTKSCIIFQQRGQDTICLPVLPPIPGKQERVDLYQAIEQIRYSSDGQNLGLQDPGSPVIQALQKLNNLDDYDQRGRHLLSIAVKNRNVPLIETMLRMGADINGNALSDSPLHNFWLTDDSFQKDIKVLKVMLAHSPNLKKKNKWDDTVQSHLEHSLNILSKPNQEALQKLLKMR